MSTLNENIEPSTEEKLETIAERRWRAYPQMREGLTDDWSVVAEKHREAHRQRVAQLAQAQGGLDALLPHIEAQERKNDEAEAERQARVAAQPTPPPDATVDDSAAKVADNVAPVAGTPDAAACPIDFLQTVFFPDTVTEGNIRVTIANTVSFERRDRAKIAQEIADGPDGEVRVSMQTRTVQLQDWEQPAVAMKMPHPSSMPAPSMTLRHVETGDAYAIWLLLETVDLRARALPKELAGDAPLPGYGGWSIEGHADVAYPIEELERALASEEAPPKAQPELSAARADILARAKKAIQCYGLNKVRKRAHNLRTHATAQACAAAGLAVVDVHSIDDDGECTCQWAKQKAIDEGRKPPAPCGTPGKHPRGRSWQTDATTDPEKILARWSNAKGYTNVGVVFGSKTGVVLIEGDGDDGAATLEQWRTERGLPETVTCVSGSGGLHLYYRVPADWDIRNSVKIIGAGVDARGEHGFAVTADSRHLSGHPVAWKDGAGVYAWQEGHGPDEIAIADAPDWLLRKMFFATKDKRNETAPDGSKWEDAGLEEPAPGADSDTSTDDGTTDPFAGIGSSGGGWGAKVELIGHGEGLKGFDGQIYSAACSYFGTFGYEADATLLKAKLLERIRIAPEDTPGHRDRYLTDEYLDGRIAQARDYMKSQGGESEKAKGPLDPWPRGYCASGGYLCYERPKTAADGKTVMEPVPMSALFEVVGRTLDETRESAFGILIRFEDEHKRSRETVILDSDARSDTGSVIARLSDAGFWIDNTGDAKAKFLTLLGRLKSSSVVTVASRPGRHDGTFLTPYGKPLGADLNMRLAPEMKLPGSVDRRGTLDGWRDNAADLMVMMDAHGTVALCAGFAGVLVDLLGADTCGLAITGRSSIGKSISQKMQASIWSDPAPRRGLFTVARATANALEVSAAMAGGTTLPIDEMKGAKAEQIGEVLMMLQSGVSKPRQDGEQGLKRVLRWRTFFTLSAEESIRELIEGARSSFVTGYAVRAVDIDASGATPFEQPTWVKGLEGRIGEQWGTAGLAFVSWLMAAGYWERPEKLAQELADATAWILDGAPAAGAKGRAAGVLAYALVAGELAQSAGVLPDEGGAVPRDEGMLRWAFRRAWQASWGNEEETPENSPETAFARLQGKVASVWHLHVWDALQAQAALMSDPIRTDGEPRLAKWFYTGPGFSMPIGKDMETTYDAMSQEGFRELTKGNGIKERAFLKWLRDTGKLLPRDAQHYCWQKLPDKRVVPHFRFLPGVFGPDAGGD